MKYATRINSFMRVKNDLNYAIEEIGKIKGVDYIDLNYPEHFKDHSLDELQQMLEKNGLKCNAVNLRFRDDYLNGEFGNVDANISAKAIQLCKEAVDVCEKMNGRHTIIWLGFDGFDYSFQINYNKVWNQIVEAFKTICDYSSKPVSIEYKPYEERVHCLIDSFGVTMMMLNEVGSENLGVTLDFCHMIMKKENPALAASWLLERDKLHSMHMNDGEGSTDDGLMVGSVNFWKTVETMYFLMKHEFEGIIYFDTFPKREGAAGECEANVAMCNQIEKMIELYGVEKMGKIIEKNDAVAVVNMFVEMLQK